MSHFDTVAARLRHDLRTPINAILGYSQLLLEEADDSQFTTAECHALKIVADAGRQLLRIVRDVLEPADATAHDMLACVARLRHEMRLPLSEARSHVETLLEARIETAAGDDLRRIASALQDLGELVDTAEHTARNLTGPDADGSASASLDAGTTNANPVISCEPRSGTILVIDDEQDNRALLARRLRREGYDVLTAETGEAGIALAEGHDVDVILLDVLMPGISGYEVLERLKQDANLRDIPVLMITALDGSASVTRSITLGADDYLAKPFDPVVLAARVNACVTKKRARGFELAYLRGVATLTQAAAAVEAGAFIPSTLDTIAGRSDALGRLARLFQHMAAEVADRERRLEAQVHHLRIAIDEGKKAAQVQEITESDYFRDLKARAHDFSGRRAARAHRHT